MRDLLFSKEKDGFLLYFAGWHNWEGEVPVIGDEVLIYRGEDSTRYKIVRRWVCERQPKQVRYIVEEVK